MDALRDDEALALVLRTGRAGENVLALAQRLIDEAGGLRGLAALEATELERIPGIGPARAATVLAAIEIGRRAQRPRLWLGEPLASPVEAATHFRARTALRLREEFHVVLLDTKHRVIGHRVVSVGTLQASLVHPREVFRPAIQLGAASILAGHNHPSGDPTPSDEDRAVTQRLEEVGVWVGIPLVDHLVLGDQSFWSFAEQRLYAWP